MAEHTASREYTSDKLRKLIQTSSRQTRLLHIIIAASSLLLSDCNQRYYITTGSLLIIVMSSGIPVGWRLGLANPTVRQP